MGTQMDRNLGRMGLWPMSLIWNRFGASKKHIIPATGAVLHSSKNSWERFRETLK